MPFAKGQSGNPGGRPKLDIEVVALAKQSGGHAIRRLVQIMDSKNEVAAIKAAVAILDRGYGKAVQAVLDLTPPPTNPPTFNINFNQGGPGVAKPGPDKPAK